jgi:hypothetical protein
VKNRLVILVINAWDVLCEVGSYVAVAAKSQDHVKIKALQMP